MKSGFDQTSLWALGLRRPASLMTSGCPDRTSPMAATAGPASDHVVAGVAAEAAVSRCRLCPQVPLRPLQE